MVLCVVRAVSPQNVRWLGVNVAHLRYAQLHARRQFVAGDAGRQLRLTRVTLKVALIHPLEKAARRRIGAWGNIFRTRKVVDRLGGVEGCSLERHRQKTGSPAIDARLGCAARIGDGDIGRQIIVLATKRITCPRSHAWEPLQGVPGAHVVFARAVRVRLAGERVDEAQLVRHLPDLRNEIGDIFAALPVLPEFPRTLV